MTDLITIIGSLAERMAAGRSATEVAESRVRAVLSSNKVMASLRCFLAPSAGMDAGLSSGRLA